MALRRLQEKLRASALKPEQLQGCGPQPASAPLSLSLSLSALFLSLRLQGCLEKLQAGISEPWDLAEGAGSSRAQSEGAGVRGSAQAAAVACTLPWRVEHNPAPPLRGSPRSLADDLRALLSGARSSALLFAELFSSEAQSVGLGGWLLLERSTNLGTGARTDTVLLTSHQ